MSAHVTAVTVHLDGSPDDTRLHIHPEGYHVLQIGSALTVHLDEASPELLRGIASALCAVADNRPALKAVS